MAALRSVEGLLIPTHTKDHLVVNFLAQTLADLAGAADLMLREFRRQAAQEKSQRRKRDTPATSPALNRYIARDICRIEGCSFGFRQPQPDIIYAQPFRTCGLGYLLSVSFSSVFVLQIGFAE